MMNAECGMIGGDDRDDFYDRHDLSDPADLSCKACGCGRTVFVNKDKRRPFYRCMMCDLVSVPEKYWLSVDDERARYDLHDNSISNDGYVKFLSAVADVAIKEYRHPRMRVLDFGCGKDAVLCRLLWDRGGDCCAYDPLYKISLPKVGNSDNLYKFDMIILCEVIEHLRDLMGELRRICGLLREGGIIIIRTRLYEDPSVFPNWWYAQDPTHINFFSAESLNKIAGMIGKRVDLTGYSDIFVLRPKD
jgi:SAM-dependent methyltransferase